MWQCLQTIPPIKGKLSHKLPSDASLPNVLNASMFASRSSNSEPCMRVGPEGLAGCVLRACTAQPASIFNYIFNLSLTQSVKSTCFKQTIIVPVPKNAKVTCLNYYGSNQHHHPRHPGPTPIHIPPQQIHGRCNLYCTPHCPFPPGQKEHLLENAVQ